MSMPSADHPGPQDPQPPAPAPTSGGATSPGSSHGSSHGQHADPRERLVAIRQEISKSVVGQDAAVTGLVIAMLVGGHVLVEGVPGVAKTLLVRSLATTLRLDTKRLQFTPDLMPGDVTGSLVYDSRSTEFSFRPGPIFTNLLLADELNRTPPKTQAALLEAMEEQQVSADGQPMALPDPFMVIATQNPVEYEGTYPLPEAQLDRFLLKLVLPLPDRAQEVEILSRHTAGFNPRDLPGSGVRAVAGAQDLLAARAQVATVSASEEVLGYVVDLVRATRSMPSVDLGVSPRGATALLWAARAWAWLAGRSYVTPDDVKALAVPALRHRIRLQAEAEMEGTTTQSVLESILRSVSVPR